MARYSLDRPAPWPPQGRITLSDARLMITSHGHRQERELANREEQVAVLRDYFGIDFDASSLDRK